MAPVGGVGLIFIMGERVLSDTAMEIIRNSVGFGHALICASSECGVQGIDPWAGELPDPPMLPDHPEIDPNAPLNRKELRARERGKDIHQVKSWENRDKPF